MGCTLVPSMKSVGQIGFEKWTHVYPISCLTLKFYFWPWVKINVQSLSGLVKWFRNYFELKFSRLKFCWQDAIPFLCNFDLDLWPWQRKGHRHLGNWMHLNGLYLGTKYEVCGSNRFWEMNPCLPNFLFDLEIWPLTLSQDQLSKFKWIGQMV